MSDYNILQDRLKDVIYKLNKKDHFCIFREAVPDYYEVIKHPMDLGTMNRKIDSRKYANLDELEADFRLMIANCKEYNEPSSVYYNQAKILEEYGNTIFEKTRKIIEHARGRDCKTEIVKTFIPLPLIYHKQQQQPSQSHTNNSNNNINYNPLYGIFKCNMNITSLPYLNGESILMPVRDMCCMVCGLPNPDLQCERCKMRYHMNCMLRRQNDVIDSFCSYCSRPYNNKAGCILCPNNVKGMMCRVSNTSWAHLWCIYGTKFIDGIENNNTANTANTANAASTASANNPFAEFQQQQQQHSCFLCKNTIGFVAKCANVNCERRVHITCAMICSNVMVVIWQSRKGIIYCKEHCPTEYLLRQQQQQQRNNNIILTKPSSSSLACSNSNVLLLTSPTSSSSSHSVPSSPLPPSSPLSPSSITSSSSSSSLSAMPKCCVCNNIYINTYPLPILHCKKCKIAVHPECYGVQGVSSNDFICDYCKVISDPISNPPMCEICHQVGRSAFKPTTIEGKWVHLYCALWIPTLSFKDLTTLRPVIGLETINPLLTQAVCQICHLSGICLKCSDNSCSFVYHPICARDSGYFMIFKEKKSGEIRAMSYCSQHSTYEREKVESRNKRKTPTSSSYIKKNKNKAKDKQDGISGNSNNSKDSLTTITPTQYWKLFEPYFDDSIYKNTNEFFVPLIRTTEQIENNSLCRIPPLGNKLEKERPQTDLIINGVEENDKIPQSTDSIRFRGYNFKNFNTIYQTIPFSLSDEVLDWVYSHCILVDTTFREAEERDIPLLLQINKINPGYKTKKSYIDAFSEKNDFILVSERIGVNGLPYLTGMCHYYFQWFQDKDENGKVNVLVCYVATLQAVKESTHPEYVKQYKVVSEPKTGVTLFAMAVEHARKEKMEYICCDSTAESVSFYFKVFNMSEKDPFPDNMYHPMGITIKDFKYWNCLPPVSKDPNDKTIKMKYNIKSDQPIIPKCQYSEDYPIKSFFLHINYLGEVLEDSTHFLYQKIKNYNDYDYEDDNTIPVLDPPKIDPKPITNGLEVPDVIINDNNNAKNNQIKFELEEFKTEEVDELRNNEIENQMRILQDELKCVMYRNNKKAEIIKNKILSYHENYINNLKQKTWVGQAETMFKNYMNKVLEYQKKHSVPSLEDQVCDVCYDDDSAFGNQIVFCDSCNVGVHQKCYNIPIIPANEWYCMRCKQNLSQDMSCFLCGLQGGALVPTDNDRWCHASCAAFIPEIKLVKEKDEGFRACNISSIQRLRYEIPCYFCKKIGYAVVQCLEQHCSTSFHVRCALNNKLTNAVVLRWVNGPDPTNPIDAIPYCLCKHHCDLPMPSNWQKLAFELIRPKMKKVKRKNDKAKSPRPRKRVRYVGESDEDDNRPKMRNTSFPRHRFSNNATKQKYNLYADQINWIDTLIKELKSCEYYKCLTRKIYLNGIQESVRGLGGLIKYHHNNIFTSYDLFVRLVRDLFFGFLDTDVGGNSENESLRCKAIQLLALIVSNHKNSYDESHPVFIMPTIPIIDDSKNPEPMMKILSVLENMHGNKNKIVIKEGEENSNGNKVEKSGEKNNVKMEIENNNNNNNGIEEEEEEGGSSKFVENPVDIKTESESVKSNNSKSHNKNSKSKEKRSKKKEKEEEISSAESIVPATPPAIITNTNTENQMEIEGEEEEEGGEEDPNALYCICREKYDGLYFQCNKCDEWYHFACLGYYPCPDQSHGECVISKSGKHFSTAGDFYCHRCFHDMNFPSEATTDTTAATATTTAADASGVITNDPIDDDFEVKAEDQIVKEEGEKEMKELTAETQSQVVPLPPATEEEVVIDQQQIQQKQTQQRKQRKERQRQTQINEYIYTKSKKKSSSRNRRNRMELEDEDEDDDDDADDEDEDVEDNDDEDDDFE